MTTRTEKLTIPLSGTAWYIMPDPRRLGEQEVDDGQWFLPSWFEAHQAELQQVSVPNSWQTIGSLTRYEGVCWYFTWIPKQICKQLVDPGGFAFLHFNGANYIARGWLHGIFLGTHEGGFTPFSWQVPSDAVEGAIAAAGDEGMLLAVRDDNTRRHDQLPEIASDWFQWGGIYRDVSVVLQPEQYIEHCLVIPNLSFDGGSGSLSNASIAVRLQLSQGFQGSWEVRDPAGELVTGEDLAAPAGDGSASMAWHEFRADIPWAVPWSPASPALYTLRIFGQDHAGIVHETRFGLREVGTRGQDILLNGKKVILKGCSLHEEHYPLGREYPADQRHRDLVGMQALGFNFLRTAHYSHDESLIEAADELGMLVGEEIPVYQYVDFKNPKVLRLATRMMRDMIYRDFNHPSVVWWSAGNEVPVSRLDCARFIPTIMAYSKHLDPTRLSSFVTKALVHDLARKHADVVMLNCYFGWYYLSERILPLVIDIVHGTAPRKPFIITEFGANAMYGFGRHEPLEEKSSEYRQVSIVSHSIKVFNSKPYLSGWCIWIYRDFKSHMRLGKFEQGYNRKGLVDELDRKKLLATWMPKLLGQKMRYSSLQHALASIMAKMIWPFMAALGTIIDLAGPAVNNASSKGYYTSEPENACSSP